LNRRANRLAHRLRRCGAVPDTLAGVCMRRSPEMVAAILGVLKAGAAFLPLDPAYPRERLAFMLRDTRASLLLTQPALVPDLPDHEANVLALDPAWGEFADEPDHDPPGGTDGDSLAYAIYTSGSTGRPKGTLVPHRGLSNYLAWAAAAYEVAAGTGSPLHSSISFDLTLTSLFPPLLAGRAVHVLPEGGGVETLRAAFRDAADYSLVKITPAHLELLGQVLGSGEAAGRTRAFVVGGENLTGRQLAFWQAHAPDTVLVNGSGQYSIWPGDRENAPGWEDAGKSGTRAECLEHVREVWTGGVRPRRRPAAGKKPLAELCHGDR
jgi:non-ribosomal peptide synthetase component F